MKNILVFLFLGGLAPCALVGMEVMSCDRPNIIAHRGASGYATENTMKAFEKAKEMKADGVEFDVMATRDEQAIGFHDQNTSRLVPHLTPPLEISKTNWKDLKNISVSSNGFEKEHIPPLEEILEFQSLWKRGYSFFEIKDSSENLIKASVKSFNHFFKNNRSIDVHDFFSNFYFISFFPKQIYRIKKAFANHDQFKTVKVKTLFVVNSCSQMTEIGEWCVQQKEDLQQVIEKAQEIGVTGIDVEFMPGLSHTVTETIKRAGFELAFWTRGEYDTHKSYYEALKHTPLFYTSNYPDITQKKTVF